MLALVAGAEMDFLLPSFVQKRLLRYALSRLELVDTEALDLDTLGIRWGQRSTFELRELGLKLEVRWKTLTLNDDVTNVYIVLTMAWRTETRFHITSTSDMRTPQGPNVASASHDTGRHLQQWDHCRGRRNRYSHQAATRRWD